MDTENLLKLLNAHSVRCFIASDLILGSQIMRGSSFRSIGDVIWITYTIAQMLIVYSSSPALRLLGQVS